ncbi:sigma-70 family RNA polymerase sigma factor [Pseudomonadota bacterium]
MGERSDEYLMTAFAGGSMEAFERLYARHRGALYRYVLRKVGDPSTANDLYQGAWEKVIRARGKYRRDAPFRAWLYRITYNHVMDFYRRARPEAQVQPDELESTVPGPDQQTEKEARAMSLKNAILKLPPEQKDVLLLKLESGLSIEEIAAVSGIKRETAKSRLRYAVGKLKKSLKEAETSTDNER